MAGMEVRSHLFRCPLFDFTSPKENLMKHIMKFVVGILVLLLAACGPSPEQIATMTASAWTATPKPTATPVPPTLTPTPTPIPYDVNVTIVDASGAPIPEAQIVFPESGNGEPVLADAQGKFSWMNLAGDAATFNVSAQGYLPGQQTATLQRGVNEVAIILERDPYGLLPSTACAPGETLLYLEDFQDGEAQGWHGDQNDQSGSKSPGPAPDTAANSVFIFDANKLTPGPDARLSAGYDAGEASSSFFSDAVWRLHFMVNRPTAPAFSWHQAGPSEFGGQEVTETWYGIYFWGSPWNQIHVRRTILGDSGPISDEEVVTGTFTQVPGQWHWIEISSYQGHLQIWVDGKLEAEYQDSQPLPQGKISMGVMGTFTEASTTILYFDDLTVCGLSAPFTSMAPPVPVVP
jgi:hypothetical protein